MAEAHKLKDVFAPIVAGHTVLRVLSDPMIQRIRFRIGAQDVGPPLLLRVAQLIREGTIKVEYDPKMQGGAEYDMATNTFHLGFTAAQTVTQEALVVHEAVHAGFDALSCKRMTVADSEAAAYLAQCTYARGKSKSAPTVRLLESSFDRASDLVFEIGWRLAGEVLDNRQPAEADVARLRQAVLGHHHYKHYTAASVEKYDGV